MDDGAGANWCFVNGTVGVNSQSQKNRGKITISEQNKDTNARAPVYIYINTFPLTFIEDSMVEGKSTISFMYI